jgi:hypothetical protein
LKIKNKYKNSLPRRFWLAFMAVMLFCAAVFADEISITASVDKNTVALNEYIVYSVAVRGDSTSLPEPQLGQSNDFNRYGSGKSQNISIINGKVSGSITHSYTLGPKNVGKFTIPPSTLNYKGKTYSTDAIDIEVTKANNSYQAAQNAPAQTQRQAVRQNAPAQPNAGGRAFVKASVNKKTVYENEKIVYKFSFYTNVGLASNPEYFAPDFSGFWNDGSKPSNRVENIDGVSYNVSEVETALYPIGSGKKTIPPTKLKIAVVDFSSPSDFDDFFGGFFSGGLRQTQVKVLETEPVTINVLPLPEQNKPSDFSGAIGDFKINSSVDKTQSLTNEPITLSVKVSGAGNMKSVGKIDFDVKDGFRKYDAVASDISPYEKEFKIVLVPLTPGDKTIPPAKLSFFNPSKKKYETIETKPIAINISGQAVYEEESVAQSEKSTVIKRDIRYNKQITELKNYCGYYVESKGFYFLLIAVIAVFVAVKIFVFVRQRATDAKDGAYIKQARKYIRKAENEIAKSHFDAARGSIYDALLQAVSAKIKMPSETLRKEEISEKLLKEGVAQEIIKRAQDVFETLNFYAFASVKTDKKQIEDLFEAVKKIMTELK